MDSRDGTRKQSASRHQQAQNHSAITQYTAHALWPGSPGGHQARTISPTITNDSDGQSRLQRVAIDTTKYQNNVRTIWQMHETGSAQNELKQLYTDVRDLESLEQQTKGDLCNHIQELLLSD